MNVVIHILEYYSTVKRSKALTLDTMQMDPKHMMLSGRHQTQKATRYDSIYVQSPKQANPQGQRVSQWLSGAGEREKVTADGDKFLLG